MNVLELDDVDYNLEIDGELVRRTLQRRAWERRGWATIAIAYQERDKRGAWKPAKLALVRLQRVGEVWKKLATITLHGADAVELGAALGEWRDALSDPTAELESD